jgi:hypothetical protein
MTTRRAVGFIHIPKTGGSSFNSALGRALGEKIRVVSIFDFANFGDQLQETQAISGHIPFLFTIRSAPGASSSRSCVRPSSE